jgi:hypothetical protein
MRSPALNASHRPRRCRSREAAAPPPHPVRRRTAPRDGNRGASAAGGRSSRPRRPRRRRSAASSLKRPCFPAGATGSASMKARSWRRAVARLPAGTLAEKLRSKPREPAGEAMALADDLARLDPHPAGLDRMNAHSDSFRRCERPGAAASTRTHHALAADGAEMGVAEAGRIFEAVAERPVQADMRDPDQPNRQHCRPPGKEA